MKITHFAASAAAIALFALAPMAHAAGSSTSTDTPAASASSSTPSETTATPPASASSAKESRETEKFVKTAPVANEFEIESSKLALTKSTNDKVKSFAQQMVDDHTKAGQDFQTALSSSSVDKSQVPTALDKKHQKIMDKLNKADAKDFDKDYIDAQTSAHKDAVSLFSDYSKKGDDQSLKAFATQTLPTLQHHKDMVKQLKSEVKS